MVKGKGFKLGDTLVEVSIAIGIFSMVAIATIMVINASTSSTQALLENTTTREEIDAQAEALRFIQAAYSAGGELNPSEPTTKYGKIWDEISKKAIDLNTANNDIKAIISNFNPTTCSKIYDTSDSQSLIKQKAFLINTRAISSDDVSKILISPGNDNMGVFKEASTSPRVVYNKTASGDAMYNSNEEANVLSGADFEVISAEGLYIIAVRDDSGTIIVSDNSGVIETKSAYIDFYIRSCWFTPGADRPSTISTVIRLYDPSAISVNKHKKGGVIINFDGNNADGGSTPSQYIIAGSTAKISDSQFTRTGYVFNGWNTKRDGTGTNYPPGSTYTAPANTTSITSITLYAKWKEYRVTFKYQGGDCPTTLSGSMPDTSSTGSSFTIPENKFTCAHHRFVEWKGTINGGTEVKTYKPGDSYVPYSATTDHMIVTLVAQWSPIYNIIYNYGIGTQECSKTSGCKVTSEEPTRSNYSFQGWCTVATTGNSCSGTTYQPGDNFPASALIDYDTNLYAIWKSEIKSIRIIATWNSPSGRCDYDSYTRAQDGSFNVYYGIKNASYTYNGFQYTIQLNQDGGVGGSSENESVLLNRMDGKNYYYYITPYNSCYNMANTRLKVDIQALNDSGGVEETLESFTASSTHCNYWNVFAYKNGQFVKKDTCTRSPDISY